MTSDSQMVREISEAAMVKATGHGKEHWYPILEELAKAASERNEITMGLLQAHDEHLSAWWAQISSRSKSGGEKHLEK